MKMTNTIRLPRLKRNRLTVFSVLMLCLFTITPVISVYANCCHEIQEDLEEAKEALEDAEREFEAAKEAFRLALDIDDTDILEKATKRLKNAKEAKEAAEARVAWLNIKLFWCFTTIHPYGFWLSGGCEESGGCD